MEEREFKQERLFRLRDLRANYEGAVRVTGNLLSHMGDLPLHPMFYDDLKKAVDIVEDLYYRYKEKVGRCDAMIKSLEDELRGMKNEE